EHALDTETPRDTLIGERGVKVAVADDDGAALERRSDHLVDELRARRGEQGRLGPGRDSVPRQKELAHPLAERCPAGLTRRDHVAAGLPNRLGEQLGLRRLPRAVEALERDEHLRPRIRSLAGDRDRRGGLHRLACRGGAGRPRRRGPRARTSAETLRPSSDLVRPLTWNSAGARRRVANSTL